MSSQPSRRTLLAGSLAGVLTLGGCGLRLEDDAPDIPFVPGRTKLPGESALLAVLGHLESQQGGQWRTRAEALRTELEEAGVPAKILDDVEAPGSPADAAAALEGALRDCGPGLLPLMGQLTAAQITATPKYFRGSTARAWDAGKVAAADLKATRAATYALGVIATRGGEAMRKRAKATRSTLESLSVRQTTAAGKHAGQLTLGYDLDTEVRSAAGAEKLARQSIERLVGTYTAGLARLDEDRAGALETAHWMAVAQGLAEDWGARTPALIGTTRS